MTNTHFDEAHVLHDLRHFLPSQTPLKDFIHHNSLHAFQQLKFYDGIFRASKIFGYQVTLQLDEYREMHRRGRIKEDVLHRCITNRKGAENFDTWRALAVTKDYDENNVPRIGMLRANWKSSYGTDLDNLVQPLLFRVLCSYLDQGIALWHFPVENKGFLASIRELEENSFTSFFKSSRVKKLLKGGNLSIEALLKIVVGDEKYFSQYLFDQQFSHRGWSGMVATVEAQPQTLLNPRTVSLRDLIVFELLLEIDALDIRLGKKWLPLASQLKESPPDLFGQTTGTQLQEVFKIWQDAFEWSYYDDVLAGLLHNKKQALVVLVEPNGSKPASFQAMFCIDERECSLRRHLEKTDTQCETLGSPGFFGVEFYFQPQHAKFYDKLCPAPVTPKYLIKEQNVPEKRHDDLLYTNQTHTLAAGFLGSIVFGFWAGIRTGLNLFRPKMSPAISNAFTHMSNAGSLTVENKNEDNRERDLQVGFTIEEMTARVEGLLRGIGLIKNFASLIYVVAHGSSSANNPHHGAHDCGACSGRPGSVNSRVFSFMANHREVRKKLARRGIQIPFDTQFVGALHDTAGDEIEFYDVRDLNVINSSAHKKNKASFETALDLNAKERSRRFASIRTKNDIKKIRRAVKDRSVSLFEPRPELGHGTNSICIVGNRQLTKGLFLDRRAFLNSYDYKTDPEGNYLTAVMRPLGPVCGGINLEYYFSRVDNYKLGAGTKLPHNVMGLFGVANSSDGDLRPGLPLQMIEVHDPVRLLIIVEHFPEIVLKSIQSSPEMYEWFINEWVHLVVFNPATNRLCYFKDGSFIPYQPLAKKTNVFTDVHLLMENAKAMETNNIVDATTENLPVYLYN